MLLYTWTGFMAALQRIFEWIFRMMEIPNRNVNIGFIAIGVVGLLYWLWRQVQYNIAAKQNHTIK